MSEVSHTNDKRRLRSGGFLVGLLCGAVVGTAVGVLIARKSGAELRGGRSRVEESLGAGRRSHRRP